MVLPLRIRDFRRLASDNHRPVLIPHAAAAIRKGITIGHVWIRVYRDGGDFQFPVPSPLVQRLDVLENMLEPVSAGIQQAFGKPVKHEGVIGVRGMAEAKMLCFHKIASERPEHEV